MKQKFYSIKRCCLFLFAISLLLTAGNALAQTAVIIKGTVTDAVTGQTMPGVTVGIKGNTSGSFTDINGGFSFCVGTGSNLTV